MSKFQNSEDPMAFFIWKSSLMSGSLLPGTSVTSLAQKNTMKRLKNHMIHQTKFGLNKILTKKNFDELLDFEVFDKDKHGNDVANLASLFMK